MLLTCLKCGNQTLCESSKQGQDFECVCGAVHRIPVVIDAGVQPSFRLAEKTRTRAFRAAGVVKNVGGTALLVASLGALFPPLGFVGALVGVYQLLGLKGAKGRYSGRQSAIIAVVGGLFVGFAGSWFWYSKWQERHQRQLVHLQEGAKSDLRNLLRAQRLYHATEGRYGSFEECAYVAKDGFYTLYLGPTELSPGRLKTLPLPKHLETKLEQDAFRAFAVGNLDEDDKLDIWEVNEGGQIQNLSDDLND